MRSLTRAAPKVLWPTAVRSKLITLYALLASGGVSFHRYYVAIGVKMDSTQEGG